jgi:hypothetical protein
VLPFIQLYQVRMVGKNKTLNASRRVRELQTA